MSVDQCFFLILVMWHKWLLTSSLNMQIWQLTFFFWLIKWLCLFRQASKLATKSNVEQEMRGNLMLFKVYKLATNYNPREKQLLLCETPCR